jgi:signal transduction histidine kinase/HPt (histidine-containing phosphotransfer) domain-containing protein/ActR/RegA family two-component response regulator
VTREEREAIEAVKSSRRSMVFANERSTELFQTVDGRMGGAGARLCGWLTGFFGIGFQPVAIPWDQVLSGLADGTVDFTAELSPTPERRNAYFMTGALSERPIQYLRLPGARPLSEILAVRPLRYAYGQGSVNFRMARSHVQRPYVAYRVRSLEEAWQKLRNGEVDAYVAEAPVLGSFDLYGTVEAENILPMVASETALSTGNPELAPFVSAVQKFLDAEGRSRFREMYRLGGRDYVRTRFLRSLSRAELDWTRDRIAAGRPVLAALSLDDYPASFYNEREGEFQGVAADVLMEMADLTGLEVRGVYGIPVSGSGSAPWFGDGGREGDGAVPEGARYGASSSAASAPQAGAGTSGTVPTGRGVGTSGAVPAGRGAGTSGAVPAGRGVGTSGAVPAGRGVGTSGAVPAGRGVGTSGAAPAGRGGTSGVRPSPAGPEGSSGGGASVVTGFLGALEGEGGFSRADEPYMSDGYAFMSLSGYPEVGMGDVPDLRIGFVGGSDAAELFRSWFPGHRHARGYPSSAEAFGALERGEADLVMGTGNELLAMTNYLERPFFKVNFDAGGRPRDSFFWVAQDEPELRSVLSKAQGLVDTRSISARWRAKVYDYRGALARERMPFMAAGLVLLAMVIALLAVMFLRSRRAGRLLEEAVAARTGELTERTRELTARTEELGRQIAIAESASRAKSEFLARTSHEIRTPMNAIIGFSELAQREYGGPRALGYIKGIRSAGAGLLTIINDILDFSKIESGALRLVAAPYRAALLLNDAVTLIRVRIGEKPVAFETDLSPDIPSTLVGDSGRVRQVLLNILSNAVKYTGEGSIRLRAACSRLEDGRAELLFEVTDTGVGIRPGELPSLFDEFTRADEKANAGVEGTGLGLAIARRLARAMGGDLSAESVYGRGSTFRARIVQEVSDWTPMGILEEGPGDGPEPGRASFTAPGAEVLVVDDYSSNLLVAEGLLEPYGMRVSFASGGRESVDMCRTRRFDLILMDHMMPDMDGIEAVKAIRSLDGGAEPAIVALTANAVAGSREMYLANGFDDFLSKPMDAGCLDRMLSRWIPSSKRRPPLPGEASGPAADMALSWAAEPGPGGFAGTSGRVPGPAVRAGRTGSSGSRGASPPGFPSSVLEDVDIPAGVSRAGGSAMYLKILQAFRADAEGSAPALSLVPDRGSAESFVQAAHALKGALAGIGAVPLSAMAASLEKAGREGDLEFVGRELPRFRERLERLVAGIGDLSPRPAPPGAVPDAGGETGAGAAVESGREPVAEGTGDRGPSGASPDSRDGPSGWLCPELGELASGLAEALRSRDMSRADMKLELLQELVSGSEGLGKAVDGVAEDILTGDYGNALKVLDAIGKGSATAS